MTINSISKIVPNIETGAKINNTGKDSFGNILTDFIGDVNQSQLNADKMTQQYIEGGKVQIQDVMIAGEKAQTSLDLLMEIRNKALDMYTQLTQIQV